MCPTFLLRKQNNKKYLNIFHQIFIFPFSTGKHYTPFRRRSTYFSGTDLRSSATSMSSLFNLFTTSFLLFTYISLSLSISSASLITPATGSRSLLRAINDGVDQPDFAVDLNATNFDEVLKDTPATYAVVEFFAHW